MKKLIFKKTTLFLIALFLFCILSNIKIKAYSNAISNSNYNDYGIIIIELENQTTGFVSYVDGELSRLFDVNCIANISE